MARQLADLGHDLVLTARRVDRLEELRGEILAETGVRAIVNGIEAGKATVFTPRFPWQPLGLALRVLPLAVATKLTRPARGE